MGKYYGLIILTGTSIDPSSSVKCYSASTKVDSKSMNVENFDPFTHEFLSDLCTLKSPCDESTRKLEQLAQVCCDRKDSKPKGSVSVGTRRFTRSMTTTSIPVTTQQLKEVPLVKIDSEDDELSPVHNISLGNDKQYVELGHPVVSSINEFADHSSPCNSE